MQLARVGGPVAGARRPHREHPVAHRLQGRHPQPAGVDLGPGPAAGVGGVQLGPVGPAVRQVQEPDLAQPGRPVRRAGHRRGHAGPGLARVVGARDRRAELGGAVARREGLADHPAGPGADEGDRGGPEVTRHRRRPGWHGRARRRRGVTEGSAARPSGGASRVAGPGDRGRRRVRVQHRQVDHLGHGHRRGHDHRRRARGDGQLAVLAAPGPALDQLERARRRRQGLDPLAQPGVHVVVPVRHRAASAPSSAGPAPRTGPP